MLKMGCGAPAHAANDYGWPDKLLPARTRLSVPSESTPDPNRTASQVLHFPTPMLADIRRYADHVDQPLSWCIRTAWSIACADIGNQGQNESIKESPLLGGAKRRQRVELPLSIWRHLTFEAERLDRSRSWMLQRAWLIGRARLEQALNARSKARS